MIQVNWRVPLVRVTADYTMIARDSLFRPVWLVCGFPALAVGVIGIVVQLLPTEPFLILTTLYLDHSSPRMGVWRLRAPVMLPRFSGVGV